MPEQVEETVDLRECPMLAHWTWSFAWPRIPGQLAFDLYLAHGREMDWAAMDRVERAIVLRLVALYGHGEVPVAWFPGTVEDAKDGN